MEETDYLKSANTCDHCHGHVMQIVKKEDGSRALGIANKFVLNERNCLNNDAFEDMIFLYFNWHLIKPRFHLV